MNKITKFFKGIGKAIYKVVDKVIVTPISTVIYKIQSKIGKDSKLEKILNRPNVLLYLSLLFAVVMFYIVDSKAMTIASSDVEVLTDQPVKVLYDSSTYVVEGIPDTVDITLMGKKTELYLARQFGDSDVVVDLTNYQESDKPVRVKITYNKMINNLNYKIDPSYVDVVIRKKINVFKTIDYDLLNQDSLDTKLSVKDASLTQTQVVVRGSQETIDSVASIKALIDLDDPKFNKPGVYSVDDFEMVAYDNKGNKINNVEIVATNISAKIELASLYKNVPVRIETTGVLDGGRAISSIKIDDQDASSFEMTIYGDQESLDKVKEMTAYLDLSTFGEGTSKSYSYTFTKKPAGIRALSNETLNIVLNFGKASQRPVTLTGIEPINVTPGLVANLVSASESEVEVQVIGTDDALDKLEANLKNAKPYVNLKDYTVGTYPIKVEVSYDDPRVQFIVKKEVNVVISKEK